MRTNLAVFALILGGTASPALADFQVLNTPQPADISSARQSPIHGPAISSEPLPAPQPVHSRFRIARGFGHNVPLSFAVRQIVPEGVKITFGSRVDPAIRVSWQGDRPWNAALRDAVAPAGLHLRMQNMDVAIED